MLNDLRYDTLNTRGIMKESILKAVKNLKPFYNKKRKGFDRSKCKDLFMFDMCFTRMYAGINSGIVTEKEVLGVLNGRK